MKSILKTISATTIIIRFDFANPDRYYCDKLKSLAW